jgi:L-glutamine:scyllo-inosose aminotransferase/L-glutamine:2-deoxy-scyllo-inosose/3-amino-2,3-dideoxy-scyllo-inosose aminotransferase
MYSSVCDVDGYLDLANRHGIVLVEDASQAHGATWRNNRIGSFGEISVFSTQQSKLLTSGEGGLCLTNDSVLYKRMQQLRADGRQYRTDPFDQSLAGDDSDNRPLSRGCSAIAPDGYELQAVGDVAGTNFCITEFQAALLLDGLERLDEENAHRRSCVRELAASLTSVEGVQLINAGADLEQATFYKLPLRLDPSAFAGLSAHEVVPVLAAELGTDIRRIDAPLNKHPLYVPTKVPLVVNGDELRREIEPTRFALPNAEQAYNEVVTLPHQILLSAPEDMHEVASALNKVRRCSTELRTRSKELAIYTQANDV